MVESKLRGHRFDLTRIGMKKNEKVKASSKKKSIRVRPQERTTHATHTQVNVISLGWTDISSRIKYTIDNTNPVW